MSSDPSGTNTPSALRYSSKSFDKGRITVDLMVRRANSGYHEENWKDNMASLLRSGNRGIMVQIYGENVVAETMGAWALEH